MSHDPGPDIDTEILMNAGAWIADTIERWRKRRALRKIRATLTEFGFDVSKLRDDELEQRMMEVSYQLALAFDRVTMSAAQAAKAFARLRKAAAQAN